MLVQNFAQSIQLNEHKNESVPPTCPNTTSTQLVDSSSQETLVDDSTDAFERALGDTELSYFLPSRESGVNDM